jgi:hypothetical protein
LKNAKVKVRQFKTELVNLELSYKNWYYKNNLFFIVLIFNWYKNSYKKLSSNSLIFDFGLK